MRKVDIHLGVDINPEEITAPSPFVEEGWELVPERPAPDGFCWARRTIDGQCKLVPKTAKKDPGKAPDWGLS